MVICDYVTQTRCLWTAQGRWLRGGFEVAKPDDSEDRYRYCFDLDIIHHSLVFDQSIERTVDYPALVHESGR